jgi:hypothetical protein
MLLLGLNDKPLYIRFIVRNQSAWLFNNYLSHFFLSKNLHTVAKTFDIFSLS